MYSFFQPYYWTMIKIINFAWKVMYVAIFYVLYVFLTGAFGKMFDSIIPKVSINHVNIILYISNVLIIVTKQF